MSAELANDRAHHFLIASQNPDGGWGYRNGEGSVTEPTSVTVLALRSVNEAGSVFERAVAWILQAQNGDGGWGLTQDDRDSSWQTAWAILALAVAQLDAGAIRRGVEWLGKTATLQLNDQQKQITRELLDIDPALIGWPWLPGEASFVEPTALALLALTAAGMRGNYQARIATGMRYLVDRRCLDGGWNVGNPSMLGAHLPPRAVPTAWALLALHLVAPEAIQDADLTALQTDTDTDGGALALAWGVLTCRYLDVDSAPFQRRLQEQQAGDGSWSQSPYHTAVALLALQPSRVNLATADR